MMRAVDYTFPNPTDNIIFDDVLLDLAEKHQAGNVLRFWESQKTFIVLGRISKLTEDVHLTAVQEDNIPVLRRSSGGGTVLQGRGCLNYSLILSRENNKQLNDLRQSYEMILTRIVKILKNCNIESEFKPISDIALIDGEKKFSGNAQKRARHHILHHGTILYDFDLSLMKKYLLMPKDIPPYRRNRTHCGFVTNISIDKAALKQGFYNEFSVTGVDDKYNSLEESALKNVSAQMPIMAESTEKTRLTALNTRERH